MADFDFAGRWRAKQVCLAKRLLGFHTAAYKTDAIRESNTMTTKRTGPAS